MRGQHVGEEDDDDDDDEKKKKNDITFFRLFGPWYHAASEADISLDHTH